MKCWNCNVESAEVVKGPPGLAVCYPCIKKTDETADVPMVGTCTFCNGTLVAVTEVFLEETGGAPVSYGNLKHSAMTVFV
jgi:hypothetical protein